MITASARVTKQCPFNDEADECVVTITCPGDAPELHQLAADITAATGMRISHEDFARRVRGLLPAGSAVVVAGRIGPWQVEVHEDAVLR